jgi:hypothetical protein
MIIDGKSAEEAIKERGKNRHAPKRDRAEERRAVIEMNFKKCGFTVTVPKPLASNRDFDAWAKAGMGLFWHAPDVEVSYEGWMMSHGQSNHWTVTNEAERKKIGWERTVIGYWFLAEIVPACSRLKTSWNNLSRSVKLLSLEEYVVVYWTHCDLTGLRIDVSTWCWLRTRYGLGARDAFDFGGGVCVYGSGAGGLSVPRDLVGGRAVEVVKNAA